jgi:hypothetical protein
METSGPSTASGAVRQAGVDHGLGLVDAPADRGDDLVDDPQEVAGVLEANLGDLETTAAFHVYARMGVDQDIRDRRILQQRFERTEAKQFVEELVDELVRLRRRQQALLLVQEGGDRAADLKLQ